MNIKKRAPYNTKQALLTTLRTYSLPSILTATNKHRLTRTLQTYVLFWPVLMLLAIANGTLREATYGASMTELHAHQLSTLSAILIFTIAVTFLSRRVAPKSSSQAAAIGSTWLALTLCFEFLFGRYVAGHSWSRLFQDYDLLSGRLWIVLLVWVTLLPFLVFKWRERAV